MTLDLKLKVRLLRDWLAVRDEPTKCDAIFLFGGASMNIPRKGLELLRHQFADLIVTNGDKGTFSRKDWTKPEAEMFADYLRENGVNTSQCIIQSRSTNTLEDVQFGIPLLLQHRMVGSIIIVSRPFHQRRAFATIQKQYPGIRYLNCPCDEEITNLPDEMNAIGIRCIHEYERLIEYAEKGDTEPQAIPENIQQVYQGLKKLLISRGQ